MGMETQHSHTGRNRLSNLLQTVVIVGAALGWAAVWTIVGLRIYAQRAALSSGLGETNGVAAVLVLGVIFILPPLYIVYSQLREFTSKR
jgi:hypothetical protein